MAFSDLRDFLSQLRELPGEVLVIQDALSPAYEISAVLKELAPRERAPAVIFENVKGHPGVAVVGNVLGTRRRLALALNTTPQRVVPEDLRRIDNSVKPVLASKPGEEECLAPAMLDSLPILTYSERDSGPFITSGVCIARDPDTGLQSMGIHRLEVKGKDRLGILLASPPLSTFLAHAEAKGAPLEMAIAVGLDPLIELAAVAQVAAGVDKIELAGALREAPVELVRARTVDVLVPSTAEVVVEGRVLPHIRERNGPFGESSGYYLASDTPVMEVTAVTHRPNPLYRVVEPWCTEIDSLFLGALAMLQRTLSAVVPTVQAVSFLPGSVGSAVVISLRKRTQGESRRVLSLALGMGRVKKAIVVDDDVDVDDPREVEWALATRFQPDEDIVVLEGTDASPIDPSARAGRVGAALGLDATRPLGNPPEFERMRAPEAAAQRAKEIVGRFL